MAQERGPQGPSQESDRQGHQLCDRPLRPPVPLRHRRQVQDRHQSCRERAAYRCADAQELPLLQEPRRSRGCRRDVYDYGLLQTRRSQCRGMADVLP